MPRSLKPFSLMMSFGSLEMERNIDGGKSSAEMH